MFIHSLADGHLGCLYLLAIVNIAGMNMLVQISASSDFMLGCILVLGRVEWEALIHWCVLTPGLDLSLSLVSLVGEHDFFSRGDGVLDLDREDSLVWDD